MDRLVFLFIVYELCTVSLVYSNHQLGYVRVSSENSTRWLRIFNNSVRFSWINIQNESEPEWNFYLNGVEMMLILPGSWNLTRTNTSITLSYTSELNFELLARNHTYLTVETITRKGLSNFMRWVFAKRVLWSAGSHYICDKFTEGEVCGQCTVQAEPDEKAGNVCRMSEDNDEQPYFLRRLLIPTIIGSILLCGQIVMWSILCCRIRRKPLSNLASFKKPNKKEKDDSATPSKTSLASKKSNPAIEIDKTSSGVLRPKPFLKNSSHMNLDKKPSTRSVEKKNSKEQATTESKLPEAQEQKETVTVSKQPSKPKGNAVLQKLIERNRKSSKRAMSSRTLTEGKETRSLVASIAGPDSSTTPLGAGGENDNPSKGD